MAKSELFDKNSLDQNLNTLLPWQKEAYQYFVTTIADKDNTYPCIMARKGFLLNHFRFTFESFPDSVDTIEGLANKLVTYGKNMRDIGKYTSLVSFFETTIDMVKNFSVEDYEILFWRIVNNLSSQDPSSWPDEIPQDPSNNFWEFCFDTEPYFVFCATPAHKKRKSRYFPCFMITFQPRWIFKGINSSTEFGRNIQKKIRKKLLNFDYIEIHPSIKWYGQEDNFEWKQYFLSDNMRSPSKCPFKRL